METIQVVLDSKLLEATNRAVRRTKQNRSALIREALREHLKRMEMSELEERERKAYQRIPARPAESIVWEAEAAWPED
jgi:metal-responsive CopG/Arc/MetJ family transcriptional regulator